MPYALTALILLFSGILWFLNARREKQKTAIVPLSGGRSKENFVLIILRKSPAKLDNAILETAAKRAWEKKFGLNKNNAGYVESGVPGVMSVLHAHGNAFMVLAGDRASRKLQPPTRCFPDAAKELWDQFTHDVSVSLVHDYDRDTARLGLYVARLTAALCDKSCLAIYHPTSQRLWQLDTALVQQLAKDPSSFFGAAE
jgi:hypothetical protein